MERRLIPDEVVKECMIRLGSIPDDFCRAIGRIATEFALLEDIVAGFTGGMIGQDQFIGQIVTSEVSFSQNVRMLSALTKHKIKDAHTKSQLEAILKRAAQVEQQRNQIIHSAWGQKEGETNLIRVKITAKLKQGLQHQFETVRAKDLDDIADSISGVYKDLAAAFHVPMA